MNCIVSLSASPRHKALPLAKSTEAVGEINPGGVKKNKELCLAPEPLERDFMNYCCVETNRAGGKYFMLRKVLV